MALLDFTLNGTGGGAVHVLLEYTLNWQDNVNNRSNITLRQHVQNHSTTFGYSGQNNNIQVDGSVKASNSGVNILSTNQDVTVAQWTGDIYHNADGTKSITIYNYFSSGGAYGGAGQASTVVTLPTIPRDVSITGVDVITDDEDASTSLTYSNPLGDSVDVGLQYSINGGSSWTTLATRNPYSSGANFSLTPTELGNLRTATANNATFLVRYYAHHSGGSGNTAYTGNYSRSIINANPTFADFDYKDNNGTTVAVTGNDQYIVQGKSSLRATVDTSDKATANKSATMVKYNFAVAGISVDESYVTSTINKDIGVIGANANTPLVVSAIDSRGYQTQVSKTVNVLPYAIPQVVATFKRQNNFETSTDVHIEGVISRLTISGTDKNSVNTSSGVQYRYKKTTDVSYGSWVNKTSSTSSGNVSVTDFNIPTALDRNYAWDIQVKITDALDSNTIQLLLPIGLPILLPSTDGHTYARTNKTTPTDLSPVMVSHVGMLIFTTTLDTVAKVAEVYGGTWVAWGLGRAVVGMGNNGTTNYTTVETDFGSENVTLTTSQIPAHAHNLYTGYGTPTAPRDALRYETAWAGNSTGFKNAVSGGNLMANTGGGGSHENRQPSRTVYIYKRSV
jgi:hypothetical protein